jgi:hypothetical protein
MKRKEIIRHTTFPLISDSLMIGIAVAPMSISMAKYKQK